MAEALVSSAIEKLESRRVVMPEFLRREMQGLINELLMMLDLVRDHKLDSNITPDGSSYSIGDAVGKAHDILVFGERNTTLAFVNQIKFVHILLREMNTHIIEFLVSRADTRSEYVVGEDEVVGLEDDVEKLLQRGVFGLGRSLGSVLITGAVGVGKTTLARQVYNDADVVEKFKHGRAWVRLSTELMDDNDILIKLMQQLPQKKEDQEDPSREKVSKRRGTTQQMLRLRLQLMLRQRLQGTRYFIVFDDCARDGFGSFLKEALPKQENGSRLFFTSCCDNILDAKIKYKYEMKKLDSDKSWELFLKTIISGGDKEFPKKLEKKAKEMLMKCEGMPLAIKEMGIKLAKKRQSGTEWEQLLDEPIN